MFAYFNFLAGNMSLHLDFLLKIICMYSRRKTYRTLHQTAFQQRLCCAAHLRRETQQTPAVTRILYFLLFWRSKNILCHQMGCSTRPVFLYISLQCICNKPKIVKPVPLFMFSKYLPDTSKFTVHPQK